MATGFVVNGAKSRKTSIRTKFRVYGSSATQRAVALFFDYALADVRKMEKNAEVFWGQNPKVTAPGTATIEHAVRTANAETEDDIRSKDGTEKQLVVMLLRSDKLSLRAETGFVARSLTDDGLVRVEVWHVLDLQLNIFNHRDVPPQRKMRDNELGGLKKKFGSNIVGKLPLMLESDPVARWLGLNVGDIVVSTRTDPQEGTKMYYRRIVRESEHPPVESDGR